MVCRGNELGGCANVPLTHGDKSIIGNNQVKRRYAYSQGKASCFRIADDVVRGADYTALGVKVKPLAQLSALHGGVAFKPLTF